MMILYHFCIKDIYLLSFHFLWGNRATLEFISNHEYVLVEIISGYCVSMISMFYAAQHIRF